MSSVMSFICTRCLRSSQQLRLAMPSRYSTVITSQHSNLASQRHSTIETPPRRTIARISTSTRRLYPRIRTSAYSTATQEHISSAPPPIPNTSSSATATSQSISSKPTTAVLNPQLSESGTPLQITITPRAAQRLHKLMQTDQNPELALRITVESGGCHGFQYLMSVTGGGDGGEKDIDLEEDTLFVYDVAQEQVEQQDGHKEGARRLGSGKAKVVMDSASLELLEGSKVDYTMELIGSQFKIVDNPRATSSCGCGTSFDVKI